ncbi:MFS transporter [Sciscionella marina]|uniref:MFS transporter n=1 Tax=Sciscionella marina TaxID=508770 RepID=UPI000379C963|nr:MFS transporter [Sciscionella marina]
MSPRLQRGAVALVQVFGLAVWFSVSAVVPSLRADWGVSTTAAVWLTGSVQLGFVAGALGSTALNLPDRVRPHVLLAGSAGLAAVCTVLLAWFVDGMPGALPLRFLTGVFLSGVYPVGIKLMASWSGQAARGRALGILVGALTLGSTLPHLIGGFGSLPWRAVLEAAALIGLLGAAVAAVVVRPGPHLSTAAPARNARYALMMFRERGPLLANIGYFGHMWELYALWTWIPSYLLATPAARSFPVSTEIVVFATMGVTGALGCLLGGWGADRYGRSPAAVVALVVSGTCCALSPWVFNAGPAVLSVFCAIWGAAVIADSGVFSAALSETADARFVGTALTAQTALGFALTVVSIQLIPVLVGLTSWRFAFLLLIPGPVLGALAMRALGSRATKQLKESI